MVYGRQPILEMLTGGYELEKIWVLKGAKGDDIHSILHLAKQNDVPVQSVPKERLNRFTRKNHQGVVAFTSLIDYFRAHDVLMQTYEMGETPCFLALDGVTDVRNFGAVARSAECFGIDALIVGQTDKALINAEAIKASAGALSRLTICREPKLASSLQELASNGLAIIGADTSATHRLQDMHFLQPLVIVLGAEGSGISKDVGNKLTSTFHIPMHTSFNSLNVSVTAGIVLYEVNSQLCD